MLIFERDSKDLSIKDIDNGEESNEYPNISWLMYPGGFIGDSPNFQETDYYRFDICARGTQELGEWVRLVFKVNDKISLPRIIEHSAAVTYTFIEKIDAGSNKISFHFEYDGQVENIELKTGNTKSTPMTNMYITGGFGIYTGKITITKLSSGVRRNVPNQEYPTIQSAINASVPGDTIVVSPGEYNEQLVMKDGIILVSDESDGGNEYIDVTVDDTPLIANEVGIIIKKILKRTQRTAIDGIGFPGYTNAVPMVEFPAGVGENTILDGFSIKNMPIVDHTLPGHAHTIQCRGSSPTILNNFVYNNGSSGIGSHATFKDENLSIDQRDFMHENVLHFSHPIIKGNIFFKNSGAGIGNNHYSYAVVYDNESAGNYSIDSHDAPGIGIQHGAHPLIDSNLVHHNDWTGIGCRKGKNQGKAGFHINKVTYAVIRKNICYKNGLTGFDENMDKGHGAGIGTDAAGDEIHRVIIEQNICYENMMSGIGIRQNSQAIVRNNKTYTNKMSGIGINGCTSFVLVKENTITKNRKAGIGITNGSAPVVINNKIFENSNSGIGMDASGRTSIVFNQIYKNKLGGIGIKNSSSVKQLKGNIIHENETVGVGLSESIIEDILDNRIFNNKRPGIVLLSNSHTNRINNNFIDNNGLAGTPNLIVQGSVDSGKTIKITNNTFSNNHHTNIRIDKASVFMENNFIDKSTNTGVNITGKSTIDIIRNIICNNSGPGLVIDGSDIRIYHTIFYNNAQTFGAALVSNDAEVTLKNSILNKNKIGMGGNFKFLNMDYNCIWNSFIPPTFDIGFNSMKETPEFADEDGNNFILKNNSPCIDSGEKINGVNDNYLGNAPDIGAYEWNNSV